MNIEDILQAASPLPEARDDLAAIVAKSVTKDQNGRLIIRDQFGAPRFDTLSPGCPDMTIGAYMAELKQTHRHLFDAEAKPETAPAPKAAPSTMTEAMQRMKAGDIDAVAQFAPTEKQNTNLTELMAAAARGDANARAALDHRLKI